MATTERTITAVLGPTNTGKTYYAIERMLAYGSGVIGLPLRLLAREVYDRIVTLRGHGAVALVTGEERIVPPRARYWVATVEAMPLDLGTEFLAVDEIQLCSDPERGHVFTDRLLHARGTRETLFMGSDSMKGVINQLVPRVRFLHRERFSQLSYTGARKISRLPRRSAVVGFSVGNVYAIAELLRRQKGGAAVVMGALSPRTRNAQVEMYQNGDVDFLVATDAIGMGLNLDVDHVAFSGTSKFDGRQMRALLPGELAQIAGRAGRYLNSGSFGVTGEAPPLLPLTVESIENNRFAPIKAVQWRNQQLDYASGHALIASLEKPSDDSLLHRAREADDLRTLRILAVQDEIAVQLRGATAVRLLWDVCQIPDFRNISAHDHATLLSRVFNDLHAVGRINQSWLSEQINRIDQIDGDIDTVSKRLSFIRTWTYIAQRKNWVEDVDHWRGVTRAVENRLSDALHARLTERFVDRRTSVLMRRLKQKESLVAKVNEKGEVHVEEQFVGRLSGFRFQVDEGVQGADAKLLRSAGSQALSPEFNLRADRFYNAPDTEIDFTEQGGLMWGDSAVGKLVKGDDILAPRVEVFVDDEAGTEVAEKVARRLNHFMDRKISTLFEPLMALRADETVTGMARGLGFRLVESLGVLPREDVQKDVKDLDQDGRALLRKHGVRFGQFTLFMPLLLKPAPTRLRMVLWALFDSFDEFPESPPPGLVTVPAIADAKAGYYAKAGYRLAGARAIRIDMLERLADMTRVEDSRAGFEATPDMLSITGMTLVQFADLMQGLGYNAKEDTRQKVKQAPSDAENEKPAETTEEAGPAESVEIASQTEDAKPEPPEQETFYVFTWGKTRPQNTQPRRTKPAKKPPRGKAKSTKQSTERPQQKDRPPDPDSPFAALMALKEKT